MPKKIKNSLILLHHSHRVEYIGSHKIKSIKILKKRQDVYDFTVEKSVDQIRKTVRAWHSIPLRTNLF